MSEFLWQSLNGKAACLPALLKQMNGVCHSLCFENTAV